MIRQTCAPNSHRDRPFQQLWDLFAQEEQRILDELSLFIELQLDIAEIFAQPDQRTTEFEESEEDPPVALTRQMDPDANWLEDIPPAWAECKGTEIIRQFSRPFSAAVINWLHQEAQTAEHGLYISWIELVACLRIEQVEFPVIRTARNGVIWCHRSECTGSGGQPTLAADIRLVRAFLGALASQFGLNIPKLRCLNLAPLGIAPPQHGLALHVAQATLQSAERRIRAFTATRAVRRSSDLAVPLR